MSKNRRGRPMQKIGSSSTSRPPDLVAISSQLNPAVEEPAVVSARSTTAMQHREKTPPAATAAGDEFDIVTRASSQRPADSRTRSDENRPTAEQGRRESPRTRAERVNTDDSRLRRSKPTENLRSKETEDRETLRSSGQGETESR